MKSIKKSSGLALSLMIVALPLCAMEQGREDDASAEVWGNRVLGGASVEQAAEAFLASDEFRKLKVKADKWVGRLQVLYREQSQPDSTSYQFLLRHGRNTKEVGKILAVAAGTRYLGKPGRLVSLLATGFLGLETVVVSNELSRTNRLAIQPEATQEKVFQENS